MSWIAHGDINGQLRGLAVLMTARHQSAQNMQRGAFLSGNLFHLREKYKGRSHTWTVSRTACELKRSCTEKGAVD